MVNYHFVDELVLVRLAVVNLNEIVVLRDEVSVVVEEKHALLCSAFNLEAELLREVVVHVNLLLERDV